MKLFFFILLLGNGTKNCLVHRIKILSYSGLAIVSYIIVLYIFHIYFISYTLSFEPIGKFVNSRPRNCQHFYFVVS